MLNQYASMVIEYDDLIHNRPATKHKPIITHLSKLQKIEQQVIDMKIADDIVESFIFVDLVLDYLHKHANINKYEENSYCILPTQKKSGRNCTSSTGLLYIYLSHFPRYKINICFVGTHIFIGFGPAKSIKSPLQIEFADNKTIGVHSRSTMKNILKIKPDANLRYSQMQCGSQYQPLKQLLILLNAMTQWSVFKQLDNQQSINLVYLRYFNFILEKCAPHESRFISVSADIYKNIYSGVLTESQINISDIPTYITQKLGLRVQRIDLPGMFYYTQIIDGKKLREWPENKQDVNVYTPPQTITQSKKRSRLDNHTILQNAQQIKRSLINHL